jgi:predicted dehydrogenase
MTANLGFSGLGTWGEALAGAAIDVGARVIVGHSRSAETREKFAAKFDCNETASFEELLNNSEINAVVLATPHSRHAQMIDGALRAGKHVFVEKPLTLKLNDAERCVSLARERRLSLMVGHYRRRLPAHRRMRQMIVDGELGTLVHLEAFFSMPTVHGWPSDSWRRNRSEMPLGGMTVMGCHHIDTLHYLAGSVRSVAAISKNVAHLSGIDDSTILLLEFENGPTATLSTSQSLPINVTVAAHGTDCSVWSEEDGNRLFVKRREKSSDRARQAAHRGEGGRVELRVEAGMKGAFAEQMTEFVDCILGKTQPETDGQAGLEVVRVMDAAERSVEERRTVDIVRVKLDRC